MGTLSQLDDNFSETLPPALRLTWQLQQELIHLTITSLEQRENQRYITDMVEKRDSFKVLFYFWYMMIIT